MGEPSEGRLGTIPLLNEYKYGLFRRRLLQTINGGAKIRKTPWYIHSIQFLLWTSPLLLCVPFIILDALEIWNSYYLALIYGCVMGLLVLALGLIGYILRYCHRKKIATISHPTPAHLNNDEDSIDIDACFELDTFNYIFSEKKFHHLVVHPIVSGAFSFTGCFILLPSVMLDVMHIAGVVIVFIIGWFTLCNAHYSLSTNTPHEPASFRPTDILGIRFLNRTIYVVVTGSLFILVRLLVSSPVLYLQLLYAVLCVLPIGWLLGVLPPLDALIPWIMEQVLTRLMGGSHMATDVRLTVIFLLSLASVAIVASLNDITLSLLLATAFGFLLSQDLFLNLGAMIYILTSNCRRASRFFYSVRKQLFNTTFASYTGFDFNRITSLRSYVLHLSLAIFKGVLFLGGSLVIVYFTVTLIDSSSKDLATTVLAGCVIGLYTLLLVSNSLQKVYILGIFRNPFFPKQYENIKKFKSSKRILSFFNFPRRILLLYASPLLLLAYIGLALNTTTNSISNNVWFGITASRVLRKIWQNTYQAQLELTIVAILNLALPPSNVWSMFGLGTQALFIGLAVDVVGDFLQKLEFAVILFISFVRKRKLRTFFSLNITIILVTIVFFPFVLLVIFISAVLSAPLLPLFTLPIFVVSFPRALRFWPSFFRYGSTYSHTEDSIYYEQAEPAIARAIHDSISSGAVSSKPGTYLLLRFDNRLVFATILETGYGFSTLSVRGLELQETSCHSIEATEIDSIFESVYGQGRNCVKFWLNFNLVNTLRPVDSAVIKTYSDARNVLTGIIDQPEALERFSTNLLKCLLWVFHLHFNEQTSTGASLHKVNSDSGLAESLSTTAHHNDIAPSVVNAWEGNIVLTTTGKTQETNTVKGAAIQEDTFSWSDSISSFGDVPSPLHGNVLVKNSSASPAHSIHSLIPEDRPVELLGVTSETTIDTSGMRTQSEIRLSAIPDIGILSPTSYSYKEKLTTTGNSRATSKVHPHTQNNLSSPQMWGEPQIPYNQMTTLLRQLPRDWLEFIDNSSGSARTKISAEAKQLLAKFVMACFSVMDVPCRSQLKTTPYDVHQGFTAGEFPYSARTEWMNSNQELKKLANKAYRYAVKLMYDEASLGQVSEYSELSEYLQDYDKEWHIGNETEESWEQGIRNLKPYLFSLGQDLENNVYTAHVLSLQDQVVHIGQLNASAVHGIWADLALELFYLTNDDEERYSIQAHSTVLRNLTIQAADPPLGYYVYSSGLVTTPST